MKKFTARKISGSLKKSEIQQISGLLNTIGKHQLLFTPWATYPYKPVVEFSMAYTSHLLLLKFFVEENEIRAVNHQTNAAVWEDSCVECFISFDEGSNYYNLEFNCIGTGLIGYGKSKTNRILLHEDMIKQVATLSTISRANNGKISWTLTLTIPLNIFVYTNLVTLEKQPCRANFYKCGDLLSAPHFVSWSNIIHHKPNFHLPEYFGDLIFK